MSATYGRDSYDSPSSNFHGGSHRREPYEPPHVDNCEPALILTHLPSCAIPINRTTDRCDQPYPPPPRNCYPPQYPPPPNCYPYYPPPCENFRGFEAMITPVTNLVVNGKTDTGVVRFEMRRNNGRITLQWQPFTCNLSGGGTAFLSARQSLTNLPIWQTDAPLRISVKGVWKWSFVRIETSGDINIKFYLDNSESGTGTTAGDAIIIPSQCVEWIMYETPGRPNPNA